MLEQLINQLGFRRIGVRLAISYGLLLVLIAALILMPFSQIQKMTARNKEFTQKEMRSLLDVQALSLSAESVSNALLQLLTSSREKREIEYALVDVKNRQITDLIESLETNLTDQMQLDNLQRLKLRKENYYRIFNEMVNQLEDQGQEIAKQTFIEDVQPALSALLQESKILLDYEQKLVQQHQLQSQDELEKTGLLVIILSSVIILFAAMLAWLTTRSVIKPLAILEQNALRIASGDYTSQVPASSTEEVTRVGTALNLMSAAIAQRESDIEQFAYYDPITRLPNRTYLLKAFEHQELEHYGMILMDLARLKTINETLGFDTGDYVISDVAKRIQEVTQALDSGHTHLLTKLTGGAFALLIPARHKDTVTEIFERIDAAMGQPVRCNQHAVDVSLVYGFAIVTEQKISLISLMRNAEVALYAAKRYTRQSAWYNDAQEASRLSHLSLLSDLRSAVKASELQMWLQPKLNLQNGSIYGFESLVRWQHPERGFISPAEFIPFAEKTGYISIVTQWMLDSALLKLHAWKQHYPNLSIAVNVSTYDLRDRSFPERVVSLLKKYDIAPHLLKIEMTESGIMEDPQATIELLNRLRDTGVGLSIDDFGTGYSSLAYLQKLPVDELKIDRSFVSDIQHAETTKKLVRTIIEMGHGLNLHVVAEGIEQEQEKATLIELGCDAMQGYLLSKPLYGNSLQEWMNLHIPLSQKT